MQYKGDDLDLRVPQSRAQRDVYATPDYDAPQAAGRWPRGGYGGSGDPLWVDEILLQCCNYAFDIAAANGAGEVGLEHLVNALTRVEGAARVLEARGVREAQLRRESATLIASEIPVGGGADRVTPRRGGDFEDIMRRAVEQASRRGTAASVDDVLWVILHHNREMPAVLLLRRLTPDWQRLDWGRAREVAVQQSAPEPQRIVAPSASFDTFSGRISQIEDSLRGLHADLAAERKLLADLIRDAQRDIVAQRGDAASLRSDLAQRLEGLERGLQSRTDTSRLTVQLSDRIQTLEKAVHGGLGEGARNWASLGQRLQAIETSLEARAEAGPAVDIAPLMDRLATIEHALNGRIEASARVWNGFAERLQSVERLVEAGTGDGGKTLGLVAERMGTLETALRARPQAAMPDMSELNERFGGIDKALRSGFAELSRVNAAMTDRLDVIENRAGMAPPDQSEALLILDDRMQSIERMLDDRMKAQPAALSIDPILSALSVASGRIAGLEQKLIADAALSQQASLVRDSSIVDRIVGLETQVAESAGASQQALAARDVEVRDIHDALVRLSENQLTLASSIADWRHECHNDFNAVNSQIEKMTVQAVAPTVVARQPESFPQVVRDLRTDPRTNVVFGEPEEARIEVKDSPVYEPPVEAPSGRGFWWWLFGTGSISTANKDAEIRWQRMHDRLKEARDRRRERA